MMPPLPPFPLRGSLVVGRGPLLTVEIWRPSHQWFAFVGHGRRPPAPSLSLRGSLASEHDLLGVGGPTTSSSPASSSRLW
jgi:hypothetical protein